MARISTHVLDIAKGAPAAGITVELHRAGHLIQSAATNSDGRTDAPLLSGERIPAGPYELIFHVDDYLRADAARPVFRPHHHPLLRHRRGSKLSRAAAAGSSRLQHLSGIMSALGEQGDPILPRSRALHVKSPAEPRAHFSRRPCTTCIACSARGCGRPAWRSPSTRPEISGAFAREAPQRRLVIASHLDTVPNAGAFDGILGVVLGVALIEALGRYLVGPDPRSHRFFRRRRRALRHSLHRQPRDCGDIGRNDLDRARPRRHPGFRIGSRRAARGAAVARNDCIPRVPHRTGAGARKPRPPAWHRRRHRGPEPSEPHLPRQSQSRRDYADAPAQGRARGGLRMDLSRRKTGARASLVSSPQSGSHHGGTKCDERDSGTRARQSRRAAFLRSRRAVPASRRCLQRRSKSAAAGELGWTASNVSINPRSPWTQACGTRWRVPCRRRAIPCTA